MSDLHERLERRIDELERIAKACLDEAPGDWRPEHYDVDRFVVEAWDEGPDTEIMVTGSLADANHIATWDPSTVLRGLAEDRDILRRHAPDFDGNVDAECVTCAELCPCEDIRSLARRHGIEV